MILSDFLLLFVFQVKKLTNGLHVKIGGDIVQMSNFCKKVLF